jgi:beta-galactosidase
MSLWIFTQAAHAAYVQPITDRAKVQLNGTWKFIASDTLNGAQAKTYPDSSWASVSIPHTWDSVTSVTKHSNSWYRTHFTVPTADAGKRIHVYFEGAFQVANVYVNGQYLGQHRGGYTRFVFDATNAITFGGDNVLAVKVSSADCGDCLPNGNTRLFKGYGGLYRKVWIVKTNKYHVATSDYASSGVYITPSNVSATTASVSIKTLVTNHDTVGKTFTVKNFLTDASENNILSLQKNVVVAPNTTVAVTQSGTLNNPKLWSRSAPYLYNVHANVWIDGAIKDSVNERTGFRYYRLTSSDFTLNGVSTRLRGVGKHQETEYRASAVTDAELIQDWDNLQDLGVNFVRLAHYPHAELEYDEADKRGIMVWVENGHTNGGSPTANGDYINREMVYQNYNHPSIIFWSAGNEAGQTAASQYAGVIQAADSSRPVVYASNGQTPSNVDFIFRNTYSGWYGGSMYDFLRMSDHWISETGAGMVVGTHTANAFAMNHTVNVYEPEEYGALVNEVRFHDLFNNATHVPAFSGWVFREFAIGDKYKGLINTKGLLTFSNYKKDVYYHYKSFLRTSPVIHVVGSHYFLRSANTSGQGDVKVYSNAPTVQLKINGVTKGAKTDGGYSHPNGTVINNVFYWKNVLSLGKNVISATDGAGNSDATTVYYKGTGSTMPDERATKVINLTSTNPSSPAYFINKAIADQRPFYWDFDGTGDNTFDVVPSVVAGASWIATKRQSDPAKTTGLAFDLRAAASVYVMATKQSRTPAWITSAGFTDTGVTGRWRDNNLKLVSYKLYKKAFASGAHVSLGSSAIDYVVLIK